MSADTDGQFLGPTYIPRGGETLYAVRDHVAQQLKKDSVHLLFGNMCDRHSGMWCAQQVLPRRTVAEKGRSSLGSAWASTFGVYPQLIAPWAHLGGFDMRENFT